MCKASALQGRGRFRHVGRAVGCRSHCELRFGVPFQLLLALWLAGVLVGQSHAQALRPSVVVDVKAEVLARTGRADVDQVRMAYSNRRWATLANLANANGCYILTGGEAESAHISPLIQTRADRIALEPDGVIYLRRRGSAPNVTEIDIWDRELKFKTRQTIQGSGAEPVRMGSAVLWKFRESLFWLHPTVNAAHPFAAPISPFNRAGSAPVTTPSVMPEWPMIFGMPSNQWIYFETVSEHISVLASDGALVTKKRADLDKAYRVANVEPLKHEPLLGRSRVLWAAASRRGELYVHLAGISVSSGFAYVAAIDPMTGRFTRLVVLGLPSSPKYISDGNPGGFIFGFEGALDDRVAIIDGKAGILVLYPDY